jgi:hypothetical protein
VSLIANIKKGDLLPALRLRLDADGGALENLAEADSVTVWMGFPDETVISRAATLADQVAEPGWITMGWTDGDTDQVGDISIEVEVIWPGTKPQTWPSKGVVVVRVNEDIDLNVEGP